MFNLPGYDTKTKADAGEWMELEKPNGEIDRDENGDAKVAIKLLGSDSDVFKRATNAAANKRIGNRGKNITAEGVEEESLKTMAACTVEWRGITDENGNPVPCTVENAVKLYRAFPAIKDQADKFMGDRANFLKN